MHRIILMMIMLAIAGCGKESGSKTETDGHPVQNTNLNGQFGAGPQTPEDKFAEVKRKAESGNPKDQLGLARMYYNGDGVTKDDAKAAEWYQKAADQGNAFAQYNLGMMYDKGEGVTRDAAKAAEWWKKAAAQGSDAAQECLKNPPSKQPG
jgi:TPR repeat protein